jgi:hypothetical protein
MSHLTLIKALLIAAVILLFLASVGTIAYRITDTSLEVRILGRTIRRVRLSDIEEVHRRGALVHENWSSLKFWNSVTIRRRSGWLRNFVISPDDPDGFVDRLVEAVRRSLETRAT